MKISILILTNRCVYWLDTIKKCVKSAGLFNKRNNEYFMEKLFLSKSLKIDCEKDIFDVFYNMVTSFDKKSLVFLYSDLTNIDLFILIPP